MLITFALASQLMYSPAIISPRSDQTLEGLIAQGSQDLALPSFVDAKSVLTDAELDQHFPELPDDPGEIGKETLAGIDTDGDGVRDDVQRYIFRVYAEDDLKRKAMLQFANSYQEMLNVAHQRDPELSREKSLLVGNDDSCATTIFGDFDEYFYEVKMLELVILNTRDRVEADLLANQNVGGQSFSPDRPSQDLCRF
jgi:hypothetical protein